MTAAAAVAALTLSAADLKAVARDEIEKLEGRNDTALAASLFAPGYRLHFGGNPPMDLKGHQGVLAMFHAAFPDLRIRVLGQVAQGDRVASHFVLEGTHRGDFNGVPATGKAFTTTGSNIMRFEGGQIAELWGQIDMVSLMQQLGVVPGVAAVTTEPQTVAKAAPGAKEVVRRFAEAFNRKDVAAIAREYSPKYVLDFPGGPKGHGVEGIRAATTEFIGAFPDLNFGTEDLIEEGDRVVWRWTMKGTHRGPLGPLAASNRPVVLTGISLLRVHDGKIVEDKVRADMMGLMAQVGAVPPAKKP